MSGRFIPGVIFGLLAALATLSESDASAQSLPTSSISGLVLDSSGGVLVGAVVTLGDGAQARDVVTDASGRFVLESATPAPRTLTVRFPGFEASTATASPGADLRIVLRPDGISETVTVDATTRTPRRVTSATRTDTALRDIPQAISVVPQTLIADQRMQSMADVVRYMPGVGMAQGEGNRDTPILRGNSTTSDFFVDGVRDDVQYFRDVYNVERVEALKGPNAMIFGRGGVGGVINRVSRQADWNPSREVALQLGSWNDRRLTTDLGGAFGERAAGRVTAMYQTADSYRSGVSLERVGVNPTLAFNLSDRTMVRAGLRVLPRRTDGRSRHLVVRRTSARDGAVDVLRRPGRQHVERPRTRRERTGRASLRQRPRAPQPRELCRLRQVLPERISWGDEC